MKNRRSRQRGIGFLGILFWLILAGSLLTVVLRLGPSYMEYMTVKSVMTSVRDDPSAVGAPRPAILRMITTRLDINNVGSVGPRDFHFERVPDGGTEVRVAYEVRKPVAFNVDAVLMFEHKEVIPAP